MRYGTERQTEYLQRLANELGYQEIAPALADLTRFGARDTLNVEEASQAIEELKALSADGGAERRGKGRRFLTARNLRQIATGERQPPHDLDEDAQWVLERLRMVVAIQALGTPASAAPLNGDGPILMEHVLSCFDGSWDALAKAFRVAVPSARAWGANLPPARAYEAEVLTGGRVRAPRH